MTVPLGMTDDADRRVGATTAIDAVAMVGAVVGYGWLAWYVGLEYVGLESAGSDADAATIDPAVVVTVLPLLVLPALIFARPGGRPLGRVGLVLVFAVALAIRLFFLGAPAYLSDDVYRYLWDGRVQAVGLSPYGVAPDHASLDSVEADWAPGDRVRHRVNHPHLPTIYPPVLELAYRGVAEVGGGLATWRWVLIGCDLGLAWLLFGLLRRRGRDPRWLVLYLWHPLAVTENAWSAHAELVAVTALVGAVAALCSDRRWLAGAVIGLGGAAKLLPLGLAPFALRRFGWRIGVGLSVVLVASILPFLDTDLERAFAGLGAYAETWYFNDLVFRPVGQLLGLDPEDKKLESTQLWRRALQGGWVLICLAAWWRGRDPVRVAIAITLGFILLTPTLHPWYVLWLLPLVVVEGSLAGVLFGVTVLFAYEIQIDWKLHQEWRETGWVRVFEVAPPLAWLTWEWLRRRRAASLVDQSA